MTDTSTRSRLLDEGMRLVAEQGYRATTIRQIEAAVGLQPGRGGFYRHFVSKDALFETGLQRYRADIETFAAAVADVQPGTGDLRTELDALVRESLGVFGDQRSLIRLLARDGTDLPGVPAVRELLMSTGYHHTSAVFKALMKAQGKQASAARLKAMAALALGSVVQFVEDQVVYGTTPAGASEASFVRTWVDVWEAFLLQSDD